MIARSLSAMTLFAMLAAGAPPGDASDPFLSLTVYEAFSWNTTEVRVGIMPWPDRKQGAALDGDHIWFAGVFGKQGSPDQRRRWTDGRHCPAAIRALRRVELLKAASPRIPLPGGQARGDSIQDGVGYVLEVNQSALQGQETGPMRMNSNTGTDLARWSTGMLAALEPCWSAEKPAGAP